MNIIVKKLQKKFPQVENFQKTFRHRPEPTKTLSEYTDTPDLEISVLIPRDLGNQELRGISVLFSIEPLFHRGFRMLILMSS